MTIFKQFQEQTDPQKYSLLMERLAATDLRLIIKSLVNTIDQAVGAGKVKLTKEEKNKLIKRLVMLYDEPLKHESSIVNFKNHLETKYSVKL